MERSLKQLAIWPFQKNHKNSLMTRLQSNEKDNFVNSIMKMEVFTRECWWMDCEMAREHSTIKMEDIMLATGKITKWMATANFTMNRINLLMKGNGTVMSSMAEEKYIMTVLSYSCRTLTIRASRMRIDIGSAIREIYLTTWRKGMESWLFLTAKFIQVSSRMTSPTGEDIFHRRITRLFMEYGTRVKWSRRFDEGLKLQVIISLNLV